jgi:hypothetical protein
VNASALLSLLFHVLKPNLQQVFSLVAVKWWQEKDKSFYIKVSHAVSICNHTSASEKTETSFRVPFNGSDLTDCE